jgi:hypothetical protein
MVTLVSAVAFILHCIFIIILTSLNKPVLIFSFVGLVVTEIIPSVYILVTQTRIAKSRTETSKKLTHSVSTEVVSSRSDGQNSASSSTETTASGISSFEVSSIETGIQRNGKVYGHSGDCIGDSIANMSR